MHRAASELVSRAVSNALDAITNDPAMHSAYAPANALSANVCILDPAEQLLTTDVLPNPKS